MPKKVPNLKQYLLNQKTLCEEYKWFKGIEMGRDPGDAAVKEWIDNYAAKYRKNFEDVYSILVNETAKRCRKDLKDKLPGVSEDLWHFIFERIIAEFTDLWSKEICLEEDEEKKKHLEEM